MQQSDGPQEELLAPVAFGSTVTILFSDIRGFTEYTDAHGDEVAYRMLQHHNSMVQEQIALYGGHVVKTLGDSYMVSFEAARTAVTCAIAMQRALEQYNRAQQGPKIEIGVGIDTGEPVREAEDFFGGTVNRASRICGAAGSGRVLVSEVVRHVAGRMEGAEWIDRGFFEVKGFQEPQHLFEVDWSGAAAVRAAPVAPSAGIPRTAEVAPAVSRPPAEKRAPWLRWAAAVALLFVSVIVGVVFLVGRSPNPLGVVEPPSGQSLSPTVGAPATGADQDAAPGKLLRSDDFSDPARGLFQDNRQGIDRLTFSDGTSAQYRWEYGYAEKALVALIKGPYPKNPDQDVLDWGANAAGKILDDFAVEVRAKAVKSPSQVRYGLEYWFPDPARMPGSQAGGYRLFTDIYRFFVDPGVGRYGIRWEKENRSLASGRTRALESDSGENLLRVEVRGDTMRVFINGDEIERVQHDGLARRGGEIRLHFGMVGPSAGDEVEIRFWDFNVYSLDP